ncbi:MAG: 1-phosphofructokinase family hexose kinase [Bacillota bacterium]
MNKKILVVSLNPAIDKIIFLNDLNVGGINRVNTEQVIMSAGGKGTNAARMCAQDGFEVAVLGFVAGEAGKYIEANLHSNAVTTNFVWLDGETRTNINIICDGAETEILEQGPVVSKAKYARLFDEYERALANEPAAVVFSGGLPQGVPSDVYAKMILLAQARNKPTILDASGDALKAAVASGPTWVKPNVRELSELIGERVVTPQEMKSASESLIKSHKIKCVVVSRGAEGAVLTYESKDGKVISDELAAETVDVVNALGCGDAMVAGIACGVVLGEGAEDSVRRGLKFAALNAGRKEIGTLC